MRSSARLGGKSGAEGSDELLLVLLLLLLLKLLLLSVPVLLALEAVLVGAVSELTTGTAGVTDVLAGTMGGSLSALMGGIWEVGVLFMQ